MPISVTSIAVLMIHRFLPKRGPLPPLGAMTKGKRQMNSFPNTNKHRKASAKKTLLISPITIKDKNRTKPAHRSKNT